MLKISLLRSITVSVLALLSMVSQPVAADDAPDFASATLSGDWGGARTAAWERGFQWEAGLKTDVFHGRNKDRSATRSMTHTDLKLRTDLDKVFGWNDAVAYLNVIDDRGNGSNAHAGSLMGVSNIEVPVATTRLFHAWVQKGFFDDQFSVLAGIYPIDSEFFAMDSASMLLHPAYGTPADLALTNVPSVFNNAAFGLRAKWYSPDRTVYGMGALMDGVPNDPRHPKTTAVKFGEGTFAIAEFGWMPLEKSHTFDFEPTDPADVRLSPPVAIHEKYGGTSKYAIGVWGYSRQQPDQLEVDAAGESRKRRSHGGYVLAERTLFGLTSDPLRNLTAFARYTFADPDTIAIDRSWNLGFKWRGPLASRPQDAIALGWTRGRLANKYRQQLTDPAKAEEALELSWRVEVSPWLAIQPDVQRIRHPGGSAAASAVTIVGTRFDIVF